MQSKPRKQCKAKQEKVKQASKPASKIASKAKQIEQATELSTPTSNYDSPRILVVDEEDEEEGAKTSFKIAKN